MQELFRKGMNKINILILIKKEERNSSLTLKAFNILKTLNGINNTKLCLVFCKTIV